MITTLALLTIAATTVTLAGVAGMLYRLHKAMTSIKYRVTIKDMHSQELVRFIRNQIRNDSDQE